MIRLVLFLYFLAAGVTWTDSDTGGIQSRATIGELAGLLVLLAATFTVIRRRKLYLTREYTAYLPLLVVFAVGVALSTQQGKGSLELLIHVFVLAVSVGMLNLALTKPEELFPKLLESALWAGTILAIIGLVQFLFVPSLFSGSYGGLSGTFRNTGQAGAFFGTYLVIAVAAVLSGLIRPSGRSLAMIALIAVALMFTLKRAALIGAVVGLTLLAIRLYFSASKRDKRIGAAFLLLGAMLVPVGIFLFYWGLENVPGLQGLATRKINEDTLERFTEGFLADNIAVTLAAVRASPLVGVGLGNIVGTVSDTYEIHSTYMAVAGTSGALGVFCYCLFIGFVSLRMWKARLAAGPASAFLYYMFPLFIGLLVSWSYTYHLRKREFWILLMFLALAAHLSKKQRSVALQS